MKNLQAGGTKFIRKRNKIYNPTDRIYKLWKKKKAEGRKFTSQLDRETW